MNMKMNKICFISLQAYPYFIKNGKGASGGSELQLYQFATYLAENRIKDVSFVVSDFGQSHIKKFGFVKVYKAYKIFKINIKFVSFFYYFFSFLRTLKNINADIYVQRAAGFETGVVALFCRIFKKKFVYMAAHKIDCNDEYIKNNFFNGKSYKFGLEKADLTIVQAKEYKKMLEENFGVKSIILKNGFYLPKEKNELERKYILWVARLDKWKQPEIFLELADANPNEKFVMIAPYSMSKGYSKGIEQRARKIDNLEFIPGVDFYKIDDYFKKAKIFVNTSKYEGFPNTFIQSAMHGVPIVSLNVNPDNFLIKHDCGFCAGGSNEKMAEEMNKVLANKHDWLRLSENAYKYAKENHDIEKIAGKFIKLLDNLK